jgi:hypothetical protein
VPSAPGVPAPTSPVDVAVNAWFAKLFQQSVYAPAVYNDPKSTDCSGNGHLTSTLYLRGSGGLSTLYYFYASRDGQQVQKSSGPETVITPAGHFKVLVAIIAWPGTVSDDALPFLQTAQAHINQDHADFAASHGYASPLVSFESTNVLLSPADVSDPTNNGTNGTGVLPVLSSKGFQLNTFDFLAVINLDPVKLEGGFSVPSTFHPAFIYMGNYEGWKAPPTSGDYYNIAEAIYHHEVSHHWGWPGDHLWSPTCNQRLGFEPFLVAPVLFGWEDTDGDGVPEILDNSPYGRKVIGQ